MIVRAAIYAILFSTSLFCCHAKPAEQFVVSKLFSPHMVLQQGKAIRVFGTATPGDSVTVSFAGKEVVATANESGDWLAEFPVMKAGTGYTLEVVGAEPQKKLVIDDVAIGEVWLCSGQSNMGIAVWAKSLSLCAANPEAEVKNANWPEIREFHVPLVLSVGKEKKDLPDTSWKVCTPENVKPFSALGYFFARQLHKDLNVPVGIIHSSYGGTNIKAWMPQESFVPAGESAVLADIKSAEGLIGDDTPQEMKRKFDAKINAWVEKFKKAGQASGKAAENWKNLDYDDSQWKAWTANQPNPEHAPQVVWYRNTLEAIPENFAHTEAMLAIPSFIGTSAVYLNGRLVGSTDALNPLDRRWASRPFKVPVGIVVTGKNVIAIRLCDYGSGITKFNDKNYHSHPIAMQNPAISPPS